MQYHIQDIKHDLLQQTSPAYWESALACQRAKDEGRPKDHRSIHGFAMALVWLRYWFGIGAVLGRYWEGICRCLKNVDRYLPLSSCLFVDSK
jgi:hypothetical protein